MPSNHIYMANGYYVYDSLILAKIALALNKDEDAISYLALASLISSELPAKYMNYSAGWWDTGQFCSCGYIVHICSVR